MLKLLVCLFAIVRLLLSISVSEIGDLKDINNDSVKWDSCHKWSVNEKGAERSYAEGGKIGLCWWRTPTDTVEEFQEDDARTENRWSRRSLCAIVKMKNIAQIGDVHDNGPEHDYKSYTQHNRPKYAQRKTLLDEDSLFSWNDMKDSADSSVQHIRVKRQKDVPLLRHRKIKYLQQLADSFPRDSVKESNIAGISIESSTVGGSADDPFTIPTSFSKNDRIIRSVRQKSKRENNKLTCKTAVEDNRGNIASQINKRSHEKKVYNRKRHKKKKTVSGIKAKKNDRASHVPRANSHLNLKKNKSRKGIMNSQLRTENAEDWKVANELFESIKTRAKRNPDEARKGALLDQQTTSVKCPEKDCVTMTVPFPEQKIYQGAENKQYNNLVLQSAEEVEHLAKELVAKVGVLENYLHYDTTIGHERKTDIPAIDDLCSNVTATYVPRKEQAKVESQCTTSSTLPMLEPKVAIKRNVNAKRKTRKKFNKKLTKNARHKQSLHVNQRRDIEEQQRKWGRWTDWSSCSVTCGKGRQIRWRYCLHDCETAEIEMEEKACQLPACPPGKFLGIF